MTVFQLLLIVIFPGIAALVGSYLRERGKNFATQKDLERLTVQVAPRSFVA